MPVSSVAAGLGSLGAERAALEQEISHLKTELSRVHTRLARPKRRGPGRYGVVWGLLLGLALAGGVVLWMLYAVFSFMGHMG
jgi:hypothetical protein